MALSNTDLHWIPMNRTKFDQIRRMFDVEGGGGGGAKGGGAEGRSAPPDRCEKCTSPRISYTPTDNVNALAQIRALLRPVEVRDGSTSSSRSPTISEDSLELRTRHLSAASTNDDRVPLSPSEVQPRINGNSSQPLSSSSSSHDHTATCDNAPNISQMERETVGESTTSLATDITSSRFNSLATDDTAPLLISSHRPTAAPVNNRNSKSGNMNNDPYNEVLSCQNGILIIENEVGETETDCLIVNGHSELLSSDSNNSSCCGNGDHSNESNGNKGNVSNGNHSKISDSISDSNGNHSNDHNDSNNTADVTANDNNTNNTDNTNIEGCEKEQDTSEERHANGTTEEGDRKVSVSSAEGDRRVSVSSEEYDPEIRGNNIFLKMVNTEADHLSEQREYFLSVLDHANSVSEDAGGRVMAACGKANLLLTSKFKQYRGLCYDYEKTNRKMTADDMQGFWELIMLQVDDVKSMFSKLRELEKSSWIITRSPMPRKRTDSEKAGTSSTPSSSKKKASSKGKTAAQKARDEARRKMLAAKKEEMRQRMKNSKGSDSPEIFIA